MTNSHTAWTKIRIVVVLALGAGLAACGGGGGDGGGSTVGTVDLTTANRDTVSHATATGLLALGASTAIPFTASPGGVALRETPQSSGAGGQPDWRPRLPRRVLDALVLRVNGSVGLDRERPQAISVSPPEPCMIAGTVTVTIDDRDNDAKLSVGDVLMFAFSNCQDDLSDVLNGSVSASITRVGATTLPSFSATMSMSQLSDEASNGRHGITLDGTVNLDFTQVNSASDRLVLTASSPVTATIHTHLPFNDTVTLQSGYVEDSTYDNTLGRTVTTLNGAIHSAAIGGIVAVASATPIVSYDADDYPSSGSVRIAGRSGVMLLTAQSASQVQIDLDAEGDGTFESTKTETWDWLL